MTESKTNSGGIGFLGLLTIVFIVLKLTHYIDWSWWLILAPIWLPVTVVVVVLIGIFAVCLWANSRN